MKILRVIYKALFHLLIMVVFYLLNNDSIIFIWGKNMERFFRKNMRNKLGIVAIISLIIALIRAKESVIFLMNYWRKENKKFEFAPESSIGNLKKFYFSKNIEIIIFIIKNLLNYVKLYISFLAL